MHSSFYTSRTALEDSASGTRSFRRRARRINHSLASLVRVYRVPVAGHYLPLRMSQLLWTPDELPPDVYFRQLTSLKGDSTLSSTGTLPVEAKRAYLEWILKKNNIVAIHASTGSGKTMKLPRILLDPASFRGQDRGGYPVAVLQLSNLAAKELIESYLHDGWRQHELHLKTGKYD